jgi:hypothetical protein
MTTSTLQRTKKKKSFVTGHRHCARALHLQSVGQTKRGTTVLAITQAGKVVIDRVGLTWSSFASEMQRRIVGSAWEIQAPQTGGGRSG